MTRLTLDTNENLLIRRLGVSDAKEVYSVLKTDDNYFRNWIDKSVLIKKTDDVKVFLMEEDEKLSRHHEVLFTVHDKLSFCGIVGLYSTDKPNNKTELVLWLSKQSRNFQYYTEIFEVLLKYGFNEMHFNRIHSKSAENDYTMIGVLKKMGLKHEGIERAGLITANKTYINLSVFAIVRTEYIEQTKFNIRAKKIFQRSNKKNSTLQ